MNLKRLAIASMAVAAVAAAPAFAACPDPAPTFGTLINAFCPSEPVGFCNVQAPGNNLRARFWGYNQGNFAVDNTTPQCSTATCGADNGNWQANDVDVAWLLPATDEGGTPQPGKFWLFGDWAGAGSKTDLIDGCPTTQSPKLSPVMYVGITDQDASGNGLFAIAWARNVPGFKADYDFSVIDRTSPPNETGQGAGNMVLRPVPRPFITGSNKVDTDTRTFSVRSLALADISQGLYGDDSSNPAEAVLGFKIYTLIRSPRSANPVTLDRAAWTPATATLPLGAADQVISVDCAVDSDVFFAYSIVGNSNFEAAGLGTARAGQCGPNIADPADPKVKPIDRGPKKGLNPNN